jgi:hypothetical protein
MYAKILLSQRGQDSYVNTGVGKLPDTMTVACELTYFAGAWFAFFIAS